MPAGTGEQPLSAASRLAWEIRRARKAQGLSQPQLASSIGYTRQYISLAEREGRPPASFELVRAIDQALHANGSLIALREEAKAEQRTLRESCAEHNLTTVDTSEIIHPCSVISHKFIPVHMDSSVTEKIIRIERLQSTSVRSFTCYAKSVDHPDGVCTLYVFPWGAAVFHLIEKVTFASITALAEWRRQTHRKARNWATERLTSASGTDGLIAHYVLSLYWVTDPLWAGLELRTAMRLLCVPRTLVSLLENRVESDSLERSFLLDGFQDGDIVDFGASGVSIGCASWAGVSYTSLSPGQSLQISDLVDYQLLVQAMWCYCHHIREQVEQGHDPMVPAGFGWRWVRSMRSKLTAARPNETAQYSSMRRAILATSELGTQLTTTMDLLRTVDGE